MKFDPESDPEFEFDPAKQRPWGLLIDGTSPSWRAIMISHSAADY